MTLEAANPDAPYAVMNMGDQSEHLKTFQWQRRGDDWLYIGTCPRCTHDVDKRFVHSTIRTFDAGTANAQTRTMDCNCGAAHAGRDGGQGCGAFWGLEMTPR